MKQVKKRNYYIQCPNCGCEYTLAEIFIPNEFFGKPLEVERDATTGKINTFFGKGMDTEETYNCDRCGKTFRVSLEPRIKTWIPTKFSTESYVTNYSKNNLFLKEE